MTGGLCTQCFAAKDSAIEDEPMDTGDHDGGGDHARRPSGVGQKRKQNDDSTDDRDIKTPTISGRFWK